MNSNTLGELSSENKIEKVFHAFGFSIPVGKDGRRLWPDKFKLEMGKRMNSGTLSIRNVQKTCQVSDKTAYKWKKKATSQNSETLPLPKLNEAEGEKAFAEVQFLDNAKHKANVGTHYDQSGLPNTEHRHLVLKTASCELILPMEYPPSSLAELITLVGR